MVTVGIITISDRSARGERVDLSGPEIRKWSEYRGYKIIEMKIVPDEIKEIRDSIIQCADKDINLILTTGGTGCSDRDVTPEATLSVIDKLVPGIPEMMRMKSSLITPHAMLSRAVAGIRKRSLIINLPGSPKAVCENLDFIEKAIPHAIEILKSEVRDCGKVNEK